MNGYLTHFAQLGTAGIVPRRIDNGLRRHELHHALCREIGRV